jgi:hypothetical protein
MADRYKLLQKLLDNYYAETKTYSTNTPKQIVEDIDKNFENTPSGKFLHEIDKYNITREDILEFSEKKYGSDNIVKQLIGDRNKIPNLPKLETDHDNEERIHEIVESVPTVPDILPVSPVSAVPIESVKTVPVDTKKDNKLDEDEKQKFIEDIMKSLSVEHDNLSDASGELSDADSCDSCDKENCTCCQ